MDMHSIHPCPFEFYMHRERALRDENAFFRGDISFPMQKSCLTTACEHLQHPDVTQLDGRTERELLSSSLITPTGCQARRDGASRFTVLYAFLINGKRIDDLAEGSDNNMWFTGHECSYYKIYLTALSDSGLLSIRWNDF